MYFIVKPLPNQFRFGMWVSDIRYFEFSVLFDKDYKLDNLHNSFKILMHKDILTPTGKRVLHQINIYNKSANLRSEVEMWWFVQLYFLAKEYNNET